MGNGCDMWFGEEEGGEGRSVLAAARAGEGITGLKYPFFCSVRFASSVFVVPRNLTENKTKFSHLSFPFFLLFSLFIVDFII